MEENENSKKLICGGGELTIAAMDEYSRLEIGRKTYRFARSVMRDPEKRKMVKERTATRNSKKGLSSTEP